jgi:glucokinase
VILASDVGGTKTILALFEIEEGSFQSLKKQTYSSRNYQTFTELLASFLSDVDCGGDYSCLYRRSRTHSRRRL